MKRVFFDDILLPSNRNLLAAVSKNLKNMLKHAESHSDHHDTVVGDITNNDHSDNRHVLMAKLILQFHDKGVLDTVLPIDAI